MIGPLDRALSLRLRVGATAERRGHVTRPLMALYSAARADAREVARRAEDERQADRLQSIRRSGR